MRDACILQLAAIKGDGELLGLMWPMGLMGPTRLMGLLGLGHSKAVAIRQAQRIAVEQRNVQQIIILPGIWIESHHVEGQPGGHGAAVIVARQPVGTVAVVVGDNLVDAQRAQVRTPEPMVEAGREE